MTPAPRQHFQPEKYNPADSPAGIFLQNSACFSDWERGMECVSCFLSPPPSSRMDLARQG